MQHNCHQLLAAIIWTCLIATGLNDGIILAQSASEPDAVSTTIGPGGMRRYERGKWSVLSLRASNGLGEAANGTSSVFLGSDARTQYTRRYWIPAESIRSTWLPIWTPENIPASENALHVSILNVIGSGNAASLNRTRSDNPLIDKSLLSLDPLGLKTGLISKRLLPGESKPLLEGPNETYETVVAVRMFHDGKRTISNLFDQFLPPYPEAYDALDQLVIADDRIVGDAGGIAAVRNWISRGGNAWIMLDLVDIETVKSLLGNAMPYEVIDRVELTEFSIDVFRPAHSNILLTETWMADEPVEFIRVALDSGDVYTSIDSWPAAFSIPFGNGQVFFTTLAARGWRNQPADVSDSVDPNRPAPGPTSALKYVADKFNEKAKYQPLTTQPVLSDALKPVLLEQLGYRIPRRSIAALFLGLSFVVIAATGIWLARREQLERIALVIPLGTLVPAIVLIAIGSANTSSVPATSSVLRLANISSETNEVHADTLAAFYSPDTAELPLEVNLSGSVTPELQDLTGVAKRAAWDDNGRGRWEQVEVASGSVRFARAMENQVLEHPLRARGAFGPDGLEGTIVGIDQLGTLGDAIIASPTAPNCDVNLEQTGTFRVGPNDTLSEGEFITDAMLSNDQQRHQVIYREILAPRENAVYPKRTTLFVWGDEISFGLTSPESFQRSGETLFALPVEIGSTPPGQPFLIPATFMYASNAAAKSGLSFAFNPTTGKWLKDITIQAEALLQFKLPREVQPCQIKNALITLKIHAPSRTIDVTGVRNGSPVVVETRKSPNGVLTISIDDPELLQLNENGALRFGVTVSSTDQQIAAAKNKTRKPNPPRDRGPIGQISERPFDQELIQATAWNIDYFRVQAIGETK